MGLFLHSFALIFCHPEFISGSILLTKPVLAQCNKVQKSAILFLLANWDTQNYQLDWYFKFVQVVFVHPVVYSISLVHNKLVYYDMVELQFDKLFYYIFYEIYKLYSTER